MPAPPKIGHGYRLVFDEAERLAERVLRFGPHPLLAKKDLFEKSREFQREAADAGCRVLKIESCERDQRKDLHYPVRDLETDLYFFGKENEAALTGSELAAVLMRVCLALIGVWEKCGRTHGTLRLGSVLLGQPGARSAKSPARLRLSEAEVTLTDFSAPAKLRTTGDLKLYEKEDVDALARRLIVQAAAGKWDEEPGRWTDLFGDEAEAGGRADSSDPAAKAKARASKFFGAQAAAWRELFEGVDAGTIGNLHSLAEGLRKLAPPGVSLPPIPVRPVAGGAPPEPPTIKVQPKAVAIPPEASAEFRVEANGSPTLKFQWRKDGADLPNATTATLRLESVSNADEGEYDVVVGNDAGSVTSSRASLTLARPADRPPKIEREPKDQTAQAGESVELRAEAGGTPPLSWQWFKEDQSLEGRTESTLRLEKVGRADAGEYSAQVTNEVGEARSRAAKVTVEGGGAPVIVEQPKDQIGAPGGTIEWRVRATGPGPLSYQWRINGLDLPEGQAATLRLEKITPEEAGTYDVILRNDFGETRSQPAQLRVMAPPEITRAPEAQSVPVGGSATFTVEAAGAEPLSYQWRKNGAVLPKETRATLRIEPVKLQDAGRYEVEVGNAGGKVSSAPVILTLQSPPRILAQPRGQAVAAGRPASLSVTAEGAAPITCQWRKNGEPIPGADALTLAFPKAAAADAASYDVVLRNEWGEVTSDPAQLTLLRAPEITQQPPPEVTAVAGQPTELKVAATGTPPLAYQWCKGGERLAEHTAATLTLAEASFEDAGEYTVLVRNDASEVRSRAAKLTVVGPPVITEEPRDQTGKKSGGAAEFEVAASGTGPLKYQWRQGGRNLAGEKAARLRLEGLAPEQAGAYDVVVTNDHGEATSRKAQLTLAKPLPWRNLGIAAAVVMVVVGVVLWLSRREPKPKDETVTPKPPAAIFPGIAAVTHTNRYEPAGPLLWFFDQEKPQAGAPGFAVQFKVNEPATPERIWTAAIAKGTALTVSSPSGNVFELAPSQNFGNGTVELTFSLPNGLSTNLALNVSSRPAPSVTLTGPATVTVGSNCLFTASLGDPNLPFDEAVQYAWKAEPSDGAELKPQEGNATLAFRKAEKFIITVTLTNRHGILANARTEVLPTQTNIPPTPPPPVVGTLSELVNAGKRKEALDLISTMTNLSWVARLACQRALTNPEPGSLSMTLYPGEQHGTTLPLWPWVSPGGTNPIPECDKINWTALSGPGPGASELPGLVRTNNVTLRFQSLPYTTADPVTVKVEPGAEPGTNVLVVALKNGLATKLLTNTVVVAPRSPPRIVLYEGEDGARILPDRTNFTGKVLTSGHQGFRVKISSDNPNDLPGFRVFPPLVLNSQGGPVLTIPLKPTQTDLVSASWDAAFDAAGQFTFVISASNSVGTTSNWLVVAVELSDADKVQKDLADGLQSLTNKQYALAYPILSQIENNTYLDQPQKDSLAKTLRNLKTLPVPSQGSRAAPVLVPYAPTLDFTNLIRTNLADSASGLNRTDWQVILNKPATWGEGDFNLSFKVGYSGYGPRTDLSLWCKGLPNEAMNQYLSWITELSKATGNVARVYAGLTNLQDSRATLAQLPPAYQSKLTSTLQQLTNSDNLKLAAPGGTNQFVPVGHPGEIRFVLEKGPFLARPTWTLLGVPLAEGARIKDSHTLEYTPPAGTTGLQRMTVRAQANGLPLTSLPVAVTFNIETNEAPRIVLKQGTRDLTPDQTSLTPFVVSEDLKLEATLRDETLPKGLEELKFTNAQPWTIRPPENWQEERNEAAAPERTNWTATLKGKFTRPGTYTIQIAATDSLTNSARTLTVTVTPSLAQNLAVAWAKYTNLTAVNDYQEAKALLEASLADADLGQSPELKRALNALTNPPTLSDELTSQAVPLPYHTTLDLTNRLRNNLVDGVGLVRKDWPGWELRLLSPPDPSGADWKPTEFLVVFELKDAQGVVPTSQLQFKVRGVENQAMTDFNALTKRLNQEGENVGQVFSALKVLEANSTQLPATYQSELVSTLTKLRSPESLSPGPFLDFDPYLPVGETNRVIFTLANWPFAATPGWTLELVSPTNGATIENGTDLVYSPPRGTNGSQEIKLRAQAPALGVASVPVVVAFDVQTNLPPTITLKMNGRRLSPGETNLDIPPDTVVTLDATVEDSTMPNGSSALSFVDTNAPWTVSPLTGTTVLINSIGPPSGATLQLRFSNTGPYRLSIRATDSDLTNLCEIAIKVSRSEIQDRKAEEEALTKSDAQAKAGKYKAAQQVLNDQLRKLGGSLKLSQALQKLTMAPALSPGLKQPVELAYGAQISLTNLVWTNLVDAGGLGRNQWTGWKVGPPQPTDPTGINWSEAVSAVTFPITDEQGVVAPTTVTLRVQGVRNAAMTEMVTLTNQLYQASGVVATVYAGLLKLANPPSRLPSAYSDGLNSVLSTLANPANLTFQCDRGPGPFDLTNGYSTNLTFSLVNAWAFKATLDWKLQYAPDQQDKTLTLGKNDLTYNGPGNAASPTNFSLQAISLGLPATSATVRITFNILRNQDEELTGVQTKYQAALKDSFLSASNVLDGALKGGHSEPTTKWINTTLSNLCAVPSLNANHPAVDLPYGQTDLKRLVSAVVENLQDGGNLSGRHWDIQLAPQEDLMPKDWTRGPSNYSFIVSDKDKVAATTTVSLKVNRTENASMRALTATLAKLDSPELDPSVYTSLSDLTNSTALLPTGDQDRLTKALAWLSRTDYPLSVPSNSLKVVAGETTNLTLTVPQPPPPEGTSYKAALKWELRTEPSQIPGLTCAGLTLTYNPVPGAPASTDLEIWANAKGLPASTARQRFSLRVLTSTTVDAPLAGLFKLVWVPNLPGCGEWPGKGPGGWIVQDLIRGANLDLIFPKAGPIPDSVLVTITDKAAPHGTNLLLVTDAVPAARWLNEKLTMLDSGLPPGSALTLLTRDQISHCFVNDMWDMNDTSQNFTKFNLSYPEWFLADPGEPKSSRYTTRMSPGKYATVLALAKANPKGGLTFEANFEQSLPHPLAFRVVLSIPKGVGPN